MSAVQMWLRGADVAVADVPVSLSQVIRGYIGDRSSGPVFEGSSPFDILGTGYQRPFELATLRLFNMVGILRQCELFNKEDCFIHHLLVACSMNVRLFAVSPRCSQQGPQYVEKPLHRVNFANKHHSK
jgi:hypothetical protein